MEKEKRMYESAIEGNITTLKTLIQEDPLILDRINNLTFFHETPLHISILRGHLEFTKALLSHKPQLATESDSFGHLPLHLAAAKGHVSIVRELLSVGAGACVARDKDGKVPLHLAIMKGSPSRVEVVSELTRASHESTRLRVDRGESVYHLCVKYDNLEALEIIVDEVENDDDGNYNDNLLNVRDDDGNSVLHLAALHKHLKIMKYLLTKPGIELNAVNNNGLTALDLVENSPRDIKTLEIINFLLHSNAQKGVLEHTNSSPTKQIPSSRSRTITKSWKCFFTFTKTTTNQLEEMRGELFVTAAIIVAMTVLPVFYIEIHGSNSNLIGDFSTTTISLWSALIIMIMLLSGFPLNTELCAWFVVQLMYTSIGFLGLYFISSMISNENQYVNVNGPIFLIISWFVLILLATLLNLIRIISWLVNIIKGCVKRRKMQARRHNVLLSHA